MREEATLPMQLKALKLSTMNHLWKSLYQECLDKRWSATRYLSALCDYELAEREKKRLTRFLKESNLPLNKSLESFNFEAIASLNKEEIQSYSRGEIWIKDARNLLLFGPSGVGKTHLAAGIGEQLVYSGYRVLFTRTTQLLQNLEKAQKEHILPKALDKLDKYDCLILDDFGYIKKNANETRLLFELIAERYERRSILITCNQPFQDWDQIFEDKKMAIAAVDRLIHHGKAIEIQGESYRKKEAIARLQSKK